MLRGEDFHNLCASVIYLTRTEGACIHPVGRVVRVSEFHQLCLQLIMAGEEARQLSPVPALYSHRAPDYVLCAVVGNSEKTGAALSRVLSTVGRFFL
jgi:hypothetical protein